MTILDRILAELGESKGPIRSLELAANVGVSESALAGMVTVLVEKSRLAGSYRAPIEDLAACSRVACGMSCVGLDECPFIVDMPETYSLVIQSVHP